MKQNLLRGFFGFVLLACISLMSPNTIQAQIYEPEGLNMPGAWNGWTNPPTNNLALASYTQVTGGEVTKITTGTTRWQTIFNAAASGADVVGGTYEWLFTSGSTGSPYGNKWGSVGTVSMNTLQNYAIGGANNSITIINGKWYTMNWKDSGYAGTSAIFMETSAAPVSISSVVQNPLDGSVNSNVAVTITVTTSTAPAIDEKLFVLYSTDNWSSHSVVELAFTGSTGTAVIPGQTTNTNVDYRIISTTISLLSAQSAEYYWMRSIRYSIDYTYNVDPLPAPGAVTLTAPANAASDIFPTVAFDWEPEASSNTYDLQVATQSDFLAGLVLDVQSIATTSYNKTLPYGNQYYWRVRGENGSGKGTWSSTYNFTTTAAKTTLTGNGGGGFGGPVGGSVLKIGDDGTNILFHFTKGAGDLNDVLVLYISNGITGRSMIDGEVNDQKDDLRRAISSAGDNASELYFPIGFEATHAIAINLGFGGLWSIPATGAVGNNGLAYVNSVNSTLSTAGQTDFYFGISFTNLGLDAADPYSILGIYLNGGNGYTSNEGYGFTASSNIGTDNLAFTSYFTFPDDLEVVPPHTVNSGNWNDLNIWSNSLVPDETTSVNIHNSHIVTISDAENIASVGINKGASVLLSSAAQFTVNGKLTNKGTLTIQSNATNTGSLIHNSDNVIASVERYLTGNSNTNGTYDFHLVSIPLNADITSAQFTGMYLYEFNTGTQLWNPLGGSTTSPLDNNQGFMVFYPNTNTTITFSGQLNNGSFTALTNTDALNEFSLVPNPFPSAIDWDDVAGWTKTNLQNVIYIWNPVSNNYASYNGTGTNGGSRYIAPGQAFFVKASAASPVLSMTNDVRVHNSVGFLKNNQEALADVFRLQVNDTESSDEIVVRFTNDALNEKDALDGDKLFGAATAPQLYTSIDAATLLSINALPHSSETVNVAVGIEYNQDGELTLNASGFDSFVSEIDVYLEDLLTVSMTNLKANPEYQFTHSVGNEPQRFVLHFMGVTGTNEILPNDAHIWTNNRQIFMNIPSVNGEKANVSCFDVTGRKLSETSITMGSSVALPAPDADVILVRIISGEQVFTKKIIKQ
jgi:hypothetical protein